MATPNASETEVPAVDVDTSTREDARESPNGAPESTDSASEFDFDSVQATPADAPIRPDASKSRRARTPKPKKPLPRYKAGMYVEDLAGIYATMGTMLYPFDPVCGGAVIASSHQCALSLDELAGKNASVQRALEALTQASTWAAVVTAHAPIMIAVAGHHMGLRFPEQPMQAAPDLGPDAA